MVESTNDNKIRKLQYNNGTKSREGNYSFPIMLLNIIDANVRGKNVDQLYIYAKT